MTGRLPVWTGGFVRDTVGISLQTDAGRSRVALEALVGLALRDNPKRAQLLVSTVLAKHVPTVPALALAAGALLGQLVREAIDGTRPEEGAFAAFGRLLAEGGPLDEADRRELHDLLASLRRSSEAARHPEIVTIGYAETATGLGHLVADALGSPYLHSTRHDVPGAAYTAFEEEHSHASDHRLYPDAAWSAGIGPAADTAASATAGTGASATASTGTSAGTGTPASTGIPTDASTSTSTSTSTSKGWLPPHGTTVLVDDELSTGRTVRNTITALQQQSPQAHWVVASLIDLRSAADRAALDELAARLGTRITAVALGVGSIDLPADVLQRSRDLIEALREPQPAAEPGSAPESEPTPRPELAPAPERERIGTLTILEPDVAPVRSARFGIDGRLDPASVSEIARSLIASLPGDVADDVLVLGSEEFIALPLAVAAELDRARGGVLFSTTTRSPIASIDRPDYAIASSIAFASHDATVDGPGPRFAYNLTRGGHRFAAVVLFPEPGVDRERLLAPAGAVEALRRITDHVLLPLLPEAAPAASASAASAAPASATSAATPPAVGASATPPATTGAAEARAATTTSAANARATTTTPEATARAATTTSAANARATTTTPEATARPSLERTNHA
ncbi:phosphoribosyltransferase domain-containing protein [Herbiconiux sp. P15]|uniref:phosphoribosyltransferase domain-containing protein n=1 Tax=Herbiconiux liukaitaii TaxID=3342799 RepID=UPI0035B81EF0